MGKTQSPKCFTVDLFLLFFQKIILGNWGGLAEWLIMQF